MAPLTIVFNKLAPLFRFQLVILSILLLCFFLGFSIFCSFFFFNSSFFSPVFFSVFGFFGLYIRSQPRLWGLSGSSSSREKGINFFSFLLHLSLRFLLRGPARQKVCHTHNPNIQCARAFLFSFFKQIYLLFFCNQCLGIRISENPGIQTTGILVGSWQAASRTLGSWSRLACSLLRNRIGFSIGLSCCSATLSLIKVFITPPVPPHGLVFFVSPPLHSTPLLLQFRGQLQFLLQSLARIEGVPAYPWPAPLLPLADCWLW